MDAANVSILVVEDNVVNQKIVVAMLKKLGYNVTVVNNGQQAIDSSSQCDFDIILMDCQMPVMDGYQAALEIRKLEKSGARVPILALSANAVADHEDKCVASGIDDMIAKPIDLEVLRQKVAFWTGSGDAELPAAKLANSPTSTD